MRVGPLSEHYYSNINHDLLSRIPLTAQSVLEFGCGSGSLGAAYKLRNPAVRYVGVEAMPGPAAEASKCLDQVWHADAECEDLFRDDPPLVDCLVYGDVLEHLRDPWACLARHLRFLAPDGVVVACIPNVQHWSVLAQLLQGRWPLEDQGLFDRTHLRWFTRHSIVNGLREQGLVVHSLTPRVFNLDRARTFVRQMEPALQSFGLDPQVALQGMAPLQYIVVAGQESVARLHLQGFSNINPMSMGEVRVRQPLQALLSRPGISVRYTKDVIEVESSEEVGRLLIWQRPIFTDTDEDLSKLKKLIAAGHLVVIDWDDDPDHWPNVDQIEATFRSVHAIQVSTPELAEKVLHLNPEVKVFSNALPSLPPLPEAPPRDQGLRLFFGALNREQDWAPLMDGLNAEMRRDPDFWSCSVVHDRAFFEALELPGQRKSFVPTCSYEQYHQEMARCDVAFLPLRDTPFNWMKSNLKAIEAGGHGLAVLASNVLYEKTLVNGETAALFADVADLQQHLKMWVENPDAARQLGRRTRQWVAENHLAAHQVAQREQWYRNLASRRAELNRALWDRVPSLRPEGVD